MLGWKHLRVQLNPEVQAYPLGLKTGIHAVELREQIWALVIPFCLLFLCFKLLDLVVACLLSQLPGKWLALVNCCIVKHLGKLLRFGHLLGILWPCTKVLRSVRAFMWHSFKD